jgi:tetratricopeptide (TPR) repeat protein
MARALHEVRVTPADELRVLLTESEKLLAHGLRGHGSNALELLRDMDRIAALWPELEAAGADLRAEMGRWETLQSATRANASAVLRSLRRLGGLPALRTEAHPDGRAAWWWYLDCEVASHARARFLRYGVIALVVVAVVVAAGLILRTLFPVDPRVQEAAGKIMLGQTKIQNASDYAAALSLFQEAAALTPEDSEAWLWLGATQQKLGDMQAAAESFRRAGELIPDETDYRTRRATVLFALGMLDEAESEVDAALVADPENPQAYLIWAGVYDVRGQYAEAVQALQHAADLADKRNLPQVSATARYRMGMLLQRMPIGPPTSSNAVPP